MPAQKVPFSFAASRHRQTPIELLPSVARAVIAAKIDALWKGSTFMAGALLVTAPYLLLVFQQMAPPLTILVWVACVLLTVCIRLGVYYYFLRIPIDSRSDIAWLNRLRILLFSTALTVGTLPLVVLPLDATAQQFALMFFVALTISTATAVVYAPYDLLAYCVYTAGVLFPVIGYAIFAGRWLEAALMVAIISTALPMARRTHEIVSGTLEARESLKFEKAAAERAREEAELANRAKSRFLAAASHDLRQPVHALTLFVTALREGWDKPDARKLVDRIEDSVSALDQLFNALLDVSKLDAGIITPRIETFQLQPLLNRMEVDYGPAAMDKGLKLHVQTCGVSVTSDSALLERVLRNLLSNAVRYTDTGAVKMNCIAGASTVRIEVEDSGIGIPKAHLDEIFQEFFQVDNPERDRSKGLGLGLAIVKRVCQILDHPLAVRSTVGAGSVFTVEVPLGERAAGSFTSSTQELGLKGAFVLVVDDEAAVLEATRVLLTSSGCHVLTAASGTEALRVVGQHERALDAVISDYRLRSGETGLEVIAAIRDALSERIPALLITGDTSPERLREAASSGYPILHKPAEPGALRQVLATAIADAKARRIVKNR